MEVCFGEWLLHVSSCLDSPLYDADMASVFGQAIDGLVEEEALGSYVLVEKEDVLDAIGTFIAAYLATVPEAQHMKPDDLQQALTSTFRVTFGATLHVDVVYAYIYHWTRRFEYLIDDTRSGLYACASIFGLAFCGLLAECF